MIKARNIRRPHINVGIDGGRNKVSTDAFTYKTLALIFI